MQFQKLCTALVAALPWLQLASASPAPIDILPRGGVEGTVSTFSLDQVPVHRNQSKLKKQGPIAYKASLAKYNATIPTKVIDAATRASASGVVTNQPEANDAEYLCPVSIGTPVQTLMLDFDTGSADLWTFSDELPTNERTGHSLYRPGSSSTSRQLSGYTWSITYGDGSGASGNVFRDKVVIGGVTATSQAVEAATSVSTQFVQDTDNDGLVGLAFSSINTVTPTKQITFFDSVKSSLASPVFAAYLRHQSPGVYDFGFIDTSKYSGSLTYAAVNNGQGFWQFTAGNYYVGGTSTGALGSVIADTGTSLILVPSAVVRNYYAKVSGAYSDSGVGGYVFPCSSTLPSFGVSIGGAVRTTPGTYINYANAGGGYCFGGIQSNQGLGFSILGDVFLKSQYVVFDGGNTRIGFAPQR